MAEPTTILPPLPAYAGPWPDCPTCGRRSGVIRDHFGPPVGRCPEHGAFPIGDGVAGRRVPKAEE